MPDGCDDIVGAIDGCGDGNGSLAVTKATELADAILLVRK